MSHSQRAGRLAEIDPQTERLIAAEERRQREKIILIPSESWTPPAVREALGSVFTSIYAEGYPRRAMMARTPDELADVDRQLAEYHRYADRRFYKGAELADVIESLAARRAAECFATNEYPAKRIHANVQALSGAAANLAVYDAFVQPGETVMAMALTEGAHLTHGSEFNVTGKRYRIVSYAIDPETGRIDYDQMRRLAVEHRPRMIIGGFTSYPWQPDWAVYRAIADEVGAILLADVAHTAGMIVGGVYPNPIGHAHVVTFTTHKTLCGPRGAVILTTDRETADRIDTAIFPGMQGGPHVNKFAALAVAFKLAQQPEFRDLQRRIVENARTLADALRERGIPIAYGGTDTHLLLIDLRKIETPTGFIMMGEIAARILDLVGLVCNKNTLPGDRSAADAHGVRLGAPWATQRGMGAAEMREIAGVIADVLPEIRPFCYRGLTGDLSRGKLPLRVLEDAKRRTLALVARFDPEVRPEADPPSAAGGGSAWGILRVRGGRAEALLREAVPADLSKLAPDAPCRSYLFDERGAAISQLVIGRLGDDEFVVLVPRARARAARAWLRGLADGYTLFDVEDIFRKVQGPAVVEAIGGAELPAAARRWLELPAEESVAGQAIVDLHRRHPDRFALDKPYFVGQSALPKPSAGERQPFSWSERPADGARQTSLHAAHRALGARMVPFAGWEMPVWYTSALDEHRAVREHAGLFDLGHMGVFQVAGRSATDFLNSVTTNYAGWLADGESQYAYLLDPDGNVLDDVMVYRRSADRYLVVANAVNEEKDWDWLTGINEGRYAIDRDVPGRRPSQRVTLRNLKAERGVVDVALQGPKSPRILSAILDSPGRRTVDDLARTGFCEQTVDGRQLLIARTGYTGELCGYEIYIGGNDVDWLWNRLLEVGAAHGIAPCGLAARDSTRTEAGLPLYGHELGGPHQIDPFEAGFGSYVKLHKPFFIGRSACIAAYTEQRREVARFEIEPGARPVREGAAILDRNGTVLGRVTSCVSIGEHQVGLGVLDRRGTPPGTPIHLISAPRRREAEKTISDLAPGDRIAVAVRGTIVPRFPGRGPSGGGGEE